MKQTYFTTLSSFLLSLSFLTAAHAQLAAPTTATTPEAKYQLAQSYINQKNQTLEQDRQQVDMGIKLLTDAAQEGYLDAQLSLGNIYAYGVLIPLNTQESIHWYQAAAKQHNSVEAQLSLGFIYANDYWDEQDHETSFAWFMKAAEQGDNIGYHQIGRAYQSGLGIEKNPELALKYYGLACDLGLSEACFELQELSQQQGVTNPVTSNKTSTSP